MRITRTFKNFCSKISISSSNDKYLELSKVLEKIETKSNKNPLKEDQLHSELKRDILTFLEILEEDQISNHKCFVGKANLKNTFLERNEYLKNKSLDAIMKRINCYFNTKNLFSGNLNSFRAEEIREKYFFDYYFYFLDQLAEHINFSYKNNSKKQPLLIGLQAGQGCGKTTICEMLNYILINKFGLKSKCFSSDDYYYPYRELQEISIKNPYLKYRGPPGTHDINLFEEVLDNFKNKRSDYVLQMFEKKENNGFGDRVTQKFLKELTVSEPLDILICEGWFNGIKPATEIEFRKNLDDQLASYSELNHIKISKDFYEQTIEFQMEVNENLKDYLKIWDYFDSFLVLCPQDFTYSRKWKATVETLRKTLTKDMIEIYIEYYWNSLPPTVYFKKLLEPGYNIKTFKNEVLNPFVLYSDFDRNYYIKNNKI